MVNSPPASGPPSRPLYHNPFCEEPNPFHFRLREDARRLFAEVVKVNDEQRPTILFAGLLCGVSEMKEHVKCGSA